MRVKIVDPAAYTPPYNHALCTALAKRGLDIELLTSKFRYAQQPDTEHYQISECFYRRSEAIIRPRLRRFTRFAEHVPNMVELRQRVKDADVVHYQWLPVQQLDRFLIPPKGPKVITAHDILPREASFGQHAAQRSILEQMDAVIVHSEHGAKRLRDEVDLDPDDIHVIPHGVLDALTDFPENTPLPPELVGKPNGPVALFFGLIRPYKGVDLLLDAWEHLNNPDAELWIVGMPRIDIGELRARGIKRVRWVPRYVANGELAATFRAADVVVLPYRQIDQSGVMFSALAFGKPIIATAVGGFNEIGSDGAARIIPPNDIAGLVGELEVVLGDADLRTQLSAAAKSLTAPTGRFSWQTIAGRTERLYRSLSAAPEFSLR